MPVTGLYVIHVALTMQPALHVSTLRDLSQSFSQTRAAEPEK